MSIWSRSHNDLAKLAKDLQERNNRVKANAARRGKGAARRQASPSDIAVLREKSLAYDTSHRRKPGDRTKSVRFVLSDEDCGDEITTEADLSDSGHCDTRHKYHKICVNKDVMNYEKRQANSILSQKRLNKESESKSKFHGKELALFPEEQNDQNSLSLCNNAPSPTTEHSNSKESQSVDNNVIRSDDADDASSGLNTEEKGVSRQILFLLQKDFINSSQGDSKQCLNMTDLEGLLSLLSVSRSNDAEDKHRNMIRMVETLILKRKSLHQKKGQAQDELDDTNDKNAKKDNIPQRGSNASKIPRKNMKNMSPKVLAATRTDDAQKHDVVNRLSIEKHNDMDQEHCSVDGDVKGVPQKGNTTGSSKEEENVDGQHAWNVPDDIHTPNTVSRSRRGDELKEMSEDEHDETKERSPREELLHMKEHEQETDVKTSGVIVRCCDIIGESGSTSKESSGMAQGSGDDDVSVPGEYLVNSCIQPILPTDGDDGGLHVGCYSSGEEHGYDSQISGQEQIAWGDCQRDSSGEESAHDSKISGQELELSQISGQEQMAGGDCQRDSSGEESAHDSKISGQELELSQISGQEQMAGGDYQRDSSGEESAHDSPISGQEQELIQISGHEKELIDHQTDISGEDHSHEAQISRHKQKFIQISGHERVARGNCQNVSSGEEHGYDLNAPGHQQESEEEHQHDSWKLLHNVDVSEMSSFSISGRDSLCPLAGDLSEHVLKSPNVFSDTLMSNGTSLSKNDNSGANITTLPSVDGSVKASLANGVQHTETIANCGNKVDVEKNQTDHSKKRLISSETDMLTKDDTWLSSDSTQSSFSSRGNTKQYQIHADTTSQSPVAAGSKFMRAPFNKGSYEINHNRKQGYYGHDDSSSSEKHLHRNCSDIESKALMNSRDRQEKIPRIKEKYCDGEVVTGDAESRGSQSDEIYQCTCHRCVSFKRTEQQSAVLQRKKPCSPPGGIKSGKSTIDRKQHPEDDKSRRNVPVDYKCLCSVDRQTIGDGEQILSLPLEEDDHQSRHKAAHWSRCTSDRHDRETHLSSTTSPCCDYRKNKHSSKCLSFKEESDQSLEDTGHCGRKHVHKWQRPSSSQNHSPRASKHYKSGHNSPNSNTCMWENMKQGWQDRVSANCQGQNGQICKGRQGARSHVRGKKCDGVLSSWSGLSNCQCCCLVDVSDSSRVSGVSQNSDSSWSSRPSKCSPNNRSKHVSFHENETNNRRNYPLCDISDTLSSDKEYIDSRTHLQKGHRHRVKPSVHSSDKQLYEASSYKGKGHRVHKFAEPTVHRSDEQLCSVKYNSGQCETAVENSYETNSKSSMESAPADSEAGSGVQLVDARTLQDILVDFQQLFVCLSRDCQHLEQEQELCEAGSQGSAELVDKAAGSERMESPESSLEHLDSEFDKVLADMKPYVLKLPHKADRQRCAVWIKKLCEPPAAGVTGRKNRNMYGQLMLHMLRRGVLEGPFDKRPSGGSLPTLPPYMSIYFDEPMTGTDGQAREGDKVPDWVNGELLESVGSSMVRRSLGNPAATSTWLSGSSTAAHDVRERPYSSLGVSLDKDPSLSPPWRRPEGGAVGSLLTSDMDWSKPYSSTTSLGSSLAKGTTFQDDSNIGRGGAREIELRTKMVEAKYHEEKLKLQQRHDAAVQKILDRKNAEIEDVKSHYRGKAKDMEDTTTKLERKIQSLVKEMSMMRDMKDRQLADLKKLVDDTSDSRKNEYDKKLHDTTAHFEQDKFEMQKQHTRNIQEILDDTNARLQRMEKEYTQQMSSNTNVIRELESRVQQLTSEVEQQLKTRSGLEEEKTTLQDTCDQLTAQLGDVRDSYNQLDREHQHLQESHEHEMRTLKHKTEASLEFLKQEHTLAAAKAADAVGDMEQQLESMRRSMKESDEHRQKQLRELDQARQQEKLHLENLHDKQIRSMKKELEQLEQESQKKIRTSEHLLQEKDLTIHRLQEQNQNQALSAERALEEFKAEVEKNQNRVYEEMKQQMTQVESDLNKSKHSREKQNKELSKQLEQERVKFNREITEMKISFEHERSQMLHDLHLQKEYILSEHEKAVETLKEGHRVELRSLEARYRERGDKDTKNLTEFESQVRELREELVQSNQLRKQQLVELGLLREEEKQKMLRDHEAEMGRMRSDMEQQRLELQKLHSSEMETMLEKTNQRLKDIEREYADRGQKSTEVVADLQAATNQLREEIKRIRQQCDLRMTELAAQHEQDKKAMKKQYATNVTALQKELDSQRNKCRNMERQLQRLEADQEEKITKLKLSNEERMRGLMPAVVRQELEDTIRSLRSQVNSLQQRAAVLQDELDLKIKNPLGPFGTLTSSPIIKSSV